MELRTCGRAKPFFPKPATRDQCVSLLAPLARVPPPTPSSPEVQFAVVIAVSLPLKGVEMLVKRINASHLYLNDG